eukprot:CAMPEP_0201522748 /NCGR_PEP_ID=MMETSP0161_2-20130828/18527_1 /ASSEMBLY_ACC=CAM_ASM_000251 /TAXON_ID=180227 /ORGANISM="Neoparamoeba aestuarina, Strain SoJaBio B1-5/56/2" /LENGTH=297 /DNA_ID=CAMNT_0047921675 /DNA_START=103 /DNA_END=993 /DNA_ORIENTATION=-
MGSAGSRMTAEEASAGANLKGKNVIVTGGNTGIGLETCRVLVNLGAHVILAARNQERGEGAVKTIMDAKAEGVTGDVEWMQLDLNSLASVRTFAEQFLAKSIPLHILINNAGIMMIPERTPTKDGFESQMGVNHVGHFYLTKLLMPSLRKAKAESDDIVRIVNLSSMAHNSSALVWDNLDSEKSYSSTGAYAQSKTANICFTIGLHDRFHNEGIHSYAVHPGVINTELGRNNSMAGIFYTIGQVFMKSIPQGAATTLYCATSKDVIESGSGKYYSDCGLDTAKDYCNVENANKLWEW